MAAPPKPWEKAGVNFQNPGSLPANNMSGSPPGATTGLPPCCQPNAGGNLGNPPPVPTRPAQQSSFGSRFSSPYGYGGYSSYSSPYSMYGGGYSPFGGGFGSYGGIGGYNRMGYGPEDYGGNSIARIAEENSRPAFQSIESIVNAFTSVSMMLDSTFQAMYNSFRAVIGVADNFTRLKSQLAQVFSAFAVFRFLRYLYRKLLVLLRLRPPEYAEEAWAKASDVLGQIPDEPGVPKKSTWPIMLFFGVIMGGPWLIWKMISSLSQPSVKAWATGEDDHFVARANFDYNGSGEDELSFKSGQLIKVAPKEIQPRMKGWLLASVDGQKVGIIPGNYVKVLGKKRGTRHQNQPNISPEAGQMAERALVPSRKVQFMESESGSCCEKTVDNLPSQKSCCGQSAKPVTGQVNELTETDSMATLGDITPDNSFENVFESGPELGVRSDIGKSTADMNAEEILDESKANFD